MLSSAQTIASKPAALPPAVQNTQPATPAGVPSFAQFLNDQSAALPAPPADTEAATQDDAAEQPTGQQTGNSTRRLAQTARPAGNTPSRAADAASKADPKAAADPADTQDDAVAATAEDDDTAETRELKEFTQLIGMAQPGATALPVPAAAKPDETLTPAVPALTPAVAAAAAVAPAAASAVDETAQGRATPRLAAADAGRTDPRDTATAKAADPRADVPDSASAKPAALRAADKSTLRTDSEPLAAVTTPHAGADTQAATVTAPSFSAALAQAQTPTLMAADAAPPTFSTDLRAPLNSPAFAPELGARVSLMAVDGVQQAELQLNPAEMGPVNVQIVVDGGQAQVSFHAVQAETRQALEQSLPDLAAALQGQGLTLSGGGVFQQAPRDADHEQSASSTGDDGRGPRRGGERISATVGTAGAPARRTVGLLDTFA